MINIRRIACALLCYAIAAVFCVSTSRARAESWPSLDDLASPRFLLIVHCRAEAVSGRLLYKVLDVWKGEYSPTAFVKQPPTGYINDMGNAGDHKPGEEVVLFYTRHNQPKSGIERIDMVIPVRAKDGALSYPPGGEEPFSEPGGINSLSDFKREIKSRINKPREAVDAANVERPRPENLAGNWRMLMTAGFDHPATIKAVGENRYRLDSGASRMNGIYELRDQRLVAIEPESTAAEGYVWKMHGLYMLTLVEQSEELSNDYRGAVLFRAKKTAAKATTTRHEPRQSDQDLNRLLPGRKTPDPIKMEYSSGFRTMRLSGSLAEFWDSVKDDHKMRGLVSDRLTREQVDAFWMLEVNIAIVGNGNVGDSKYPTLQDELLAFTGMGNRFLTGSFALHRDPPPKYLVALFRTTKGDYGLSTRYPGFCLIELGGDVGVAPIPPDAKASK